MAVSPWGRQVYSPPPRGRSRTAASVRSDTSLSHLGPRAARKSRGLSQAGHEPGCAVGHTTNQSGDHDPARQRATRCRVDLRLSVCAIPHATGFAGGPCLARPTALQRLCHRRGLARGGRLRRPGRRHSRVVRSGQQLGLSRDAWPAGGQRHVTRSLLPPVLLHLWPPQRDVGRGSLRRAGRHFASYTPREPGCQASRDGDSKGHIHSMDSKTKRAALPHRPSLLRMGGLGKN